MAKRRKKRAQAGELVAPARVLTFNGKPFGVPDRVALMPLLKFAHVAKQGLDTADLDGLEAIYTLLRSVIADEDWEAFEEHASVTRASDEDLLGLVKDAIEVISQRPTDRPSDSSDGSRTTSGSSVGDSSSRVIHRLEKEGRPSIALMVQQAQESRSAVSA